MKAKLLILLTVIFSNNLLAQDQVLLSTYNDIRRFDRIVSKSLAQDPLNIYLDDQNQNGYEVFSTKKINANLYGYITNDLGLTSGNTLFNSFGLFPVLNSYASISRNIESLDDFRFDIPYQAHELDELAIGDAIYFQASGGITAYLSIGLNSIGFGVGPKFSVQGGFTVYIEKKGEQEVFVEIRSIRVKDYSLLAGVLGAYAETAIMKELTKGVNFLIDTSTEKGKRVYEDLIRTGRADFAQESNDVVTKIGDVNSNRTHKFQKLAIVTPIIPFIDIAATKINEKRHEVRSNIWNQNTDLVTFTKGTRKTKRFFSKKSEVSKIFQVVENSSTQEIDSAKLTIKKIKSSFSTRSLVKTFRYFYRKTGLEFFRTVFLNFGQTRLGYANVEAELTLSKASIQSIGQNLSGSDFSARTANFAKKSNFKNLLEIVKVCGGNLTMKIEGTRITRSQVVQEYPTTSNCQY